MPRNVNPCNKEVKPESAYEVWQSSGGQWTWYVLKKWQAPQNEAKNEYARWLCFVTSPFCPEGEYGDVYVSDIKSVARKVSTNPLTGRKIA